MARLRLATRGSPLAQWQAYRVASLLSAAHPGLEAELVTVSTTGDRQTSAPVWEIAGQGVFVAEVQAAVIEGRADAAVHSAKDLQPREPEGLALAAVPERADPRDALVGASLDELVPGAVVATGSQRRRAQLAAARPGLRFESLRGNIGTRLSRVPSGGAIVVAMAALQRLGLRPDQLHLLEPRVMLPQVAQGALAVECRSDDGATMDLLAGIDNRAARQQVTAERAFLAALGGGCDLPVAGWAHHGEDGALELEGLVAALDGSVVVRRTASTAPAAVGAVSADEVSALGAEVASMVLAGGGRRLIGEGRG